MKTNLKIKSLLLALSLCSLSSVALADSNFSSGTGQLTAKAHLDFEVKIPRVLFLQIGTGTSMANNNTVDLVSFDVPVTLGTGNFVMSTNSQQIPVRLISNIGDVILTSSTAGKLLNPAGHGIEFTDFMVSSTNINFSIPTLNSSGSGTVSSTYPATNGVVNYSTNVGYIYKNDKVYASGTYGGSNVNNSRVTYTAVSP